MASLALAAEHRTALDDYFQAPDNHYRYDLAQKSEEQGYTAYFLRMTSQRWRGRNEVNRPIWQHWVTIYKPEIGKSSTSLLFITGGSNDDQLPNSTTCWHQLPQPRTLSSPNCAMYRSNC
jgi:PhoPQ-activated pathogenicity-related protein